MSLGEFDIHKLLDILVLLLIGRGPKVALVPYQNLDSIVEHLESPSDGD
jgi:hypothetical protein